MTQTPQPTRLKLPNNFDRSSVNLIREMEDNGWRGRNTVNGHVFMMAPDGETTACVVPSVDSAPRTAQNQLAPYRRWLKTHKAEIKAIRKTRTAANVIQQPAPAPEPEPTAPVDTQPAPTHEVCGDCGRIFATLQALSVHHVRSHVRVSCEFCGEAFSPGNLHRHERNHRNDGKTPDDLRRELLAVRREMARIRTERDGWQTLAEDAERRMVDLKASVRAIVAE